MSAASKEDPAGRVELTIEDGVGTITINRPDKLNACSTEMLRSWTEHLYACEGSPAVKAVVITGRGKAFTAGFDLGEVPVDAGTEAIRGHFRNTSLYWHSVISAIVRIDKPVLAAVNGPTVGGGIGLVLASDLAIASTEATFTPAWFSIGISIDTATSCHLVSYIGMRRATEWIYTNRVLSAREALDWGLLNRVYPPGEYEREVRRVAAELAAGPTLLYGLAKSLFHRGRTETLETECEFEREGVLKSVTDPAFAERLRMFLQKQRPSKALSLDL
jgi:2-(1,2-epoxy-1,2-dihydrophenyl)acetyl-CoA isomerase